MPFNWAGGFAVALMDPNDREAGRNFYAKRARYPLTILSGRPRRRLPPPAALRSVGVPALPRLRRGGRVRIRKLRPPGGTEGGRHIASLARLAGDEIRSAMPSAKAFWSLGRSTTPNREGVFSYLRIFSSCLEPV